MPEDTRPDYGLLTDEMIATIRPLVQGKTVVDLGAGTCTKSRLLKEWGASVVIAVDSTEMPPVEGIEQQCCRFHEAELPAEIDVGFVAWPQNYEVPGLIEILERCRVVIYLGSNYDGMINGWPGLFEHMLGRALLHDFHIKENSLVIIGEPLSARREPTIGEQSAHTYGVRPYPG